MEKQELETMRHSCAHVMAQAVQQLFPGTKLGIGPAIDNGFYYDFDCPAQFTPEDLKKIETKMKEIIPHAQVLLPNLTELCLLCDQPYPQSKPSVSFLLDCCEQLCRKGVQQIVVTGMEEEEQMCSFVYENGKYTEVYNKKVGFGRPGSGDVFAAVVSGALLEGKPLTDSVKMAAMFVKESMELTLQQDTPHAYGLCFEPLLKTLCSESF